MIAAVIATLNEADIIRRNIAHLYHQGVTNIYAVDGGSTDGTQHVLDEMAVDWLVDEDVPFRQAAVMNGLILWAGNEGAEWVLPIDADEFVYVPGRQSIAEALATTSADKLYVKVYGHRDWEHRFLLPKRLPKVAFKYRPGVKVTMGNHDCSLAGGRWGVLEMRELQFRSFDHYCRKVTERIRTLDNALPPGEAQHYRDLMNLDRDDLAKRWEEFCSEPTMFDPIPC